MNARQQRPKWSTTARWQAGAILLLVLMIGLPANAQIAEEPRIGDDADPTAASIAISQATRADGSARRVVLGRNDRFPDNLTGTSAAGDDGVLLLVDPAPAGLTDDVLAEIERLLPPDGPDTCATGLGAEVVLLGGEAALSETLFNDVADNAYCVDRISGPSRVETSVAVANAILDNGGDRDLLLIARDDNPADSAAAGAYAAAFGVPIVVTSSTSLHPAVADLLDPSGGVWTEVILLGGNAALSADVQSQVAAAAGDEVSVDRVAGATRDDTALQVALLLWQERASNDTAIVNGYTENFWTYALPGGAAAGAAQAPLLYVTADAVPDTTAGYLRDRQTSVTAVGPASEVSDAALAQAQALVSGDGIDPPPPPPPPGDFGADIRVLPLTPEVAEDGTATVTVTTEPGDYSITMTAVAVDGRDVYFDAVSGPGLELDELDLDRFQSVRDATLILPFLPDQTIQPGTYTYSMFSEEGLTDVRAIIKSGDPNARQVLDANFYVVSDHESVDEPAEQDEFEQMFRGVGEEILSQQNLGIGSLDFIPTDAELKQSYSQLELPADDQNVNIRGLCAALRELSGPSRAINFAIVDNIVDVPPDESGGETEGIAAGIPGAPLLADLTNSCVIIIANGGRGLDQYGTTTWHEAGHLLGLQHTSESTGADFDQLPDTPECSIDSDANGDGEIEEGECGDAGLNFMFYDSDSTNMTADQAFVMRHNPMFHP